MKSINIKAEDFCNTVVRICAAISLFTLYVIGSGQVSTFHKLDHADHIDHSAVQELDPCHRAIYHDIQKTNCGHDAHFLTDETCPVCDTIIPSDIIACSNHTDLVSEPSVAFYNATISSFNPPHQNLFSSRAPPCC